MWALQFICVKLVQDQVGSLFTVWGPMTLATITICPLIRLWEDGGGEFLIGPLSQRTKEFRPDNFFYDNNIFNAVYDDRDGEMTQIC